MISLRHTVYATTASLHSGPITYQEWPWLSSVSTSSGHIPLGPRRSRNPSPRCRLRQRTQVFQLSIPLRARGRLIRNAVDRPGSDALKGTPATNPDSSDDESCSCSIGNHRRGNRVNALPLRSLGPDASLPVASSPGAMANSCTFTRTSTDRYVSPITKYRT